MNTTLERMPPQSVETEMAVLGAMLMSRSATAAARQRLTSADFYHVPHGTIFTALCDLWDHQAEVDMLVLQAYLQDRGAMDMVGGIIYLSKISSVVATSANLRVHASRVAELASRRRAIEQCQRLTSAAYDGSVSSHDLGLAFLELAMSLGRDPDGERSWPLAEIAPIVETQYGKAAAAKRRWGGLDCGFVDINDLLNGLCANEFTILGADTRIGKTRLVLQMAGRIARRGAAGVLVFSLELTREQVYRLLACLEADLSMTRYLRGALTVDEEERLKQQRREMDNLPIYVDGRGRLTIEAMAAETERALALDPDIRLIVVDYMQLIDAPGNSGYERMTYVARALKEFKKRYPVHLLVLSQLSLKVQERPDRRPHLGDLREAGSIGENADNALLLWRPGAYDDLRQRAERAERRDAANGQPWDPGRREHELGKVELIGAKVRFNGPGIVHLLWDDACGRFRSTTTKEREQMIEMDLRIGGSAM